MNYMLASNISGRVDKINHFTTRKRLWGRIKNNTLTCLARNVFKLGTYCRHHYHWLSIAWWFQVSLLIIYYLPRPPRTTEKNIHGNANICFLFSQKEKKNLFLPHAEALIFKMMFSSIVHNSLEEGNFIIYRRRESKPIVHQKKVHLQKMFRVNLPSPR